MTGVQVPGTGVPHMVRNCRCVKVSRGCEMGRIINRVFEYPQITYVTLKSEFP